MMKKLLRGYSRFISKYTILFAIFLILFTAFAIGQSKNVGTEATNQEDTLPDDNAVLIAFNKVSDNFGGSDSVQFIIEIDPEYSGSDEARDVRDYEVMKYIDLLSQLSLHTDDVSEVTSSSTLMKSSSGGTIPKSNRKIIELIKKNSQYEDYISDDYQISLVKISLDTGYSAREVEKDLMPLLDYIPKPAGIKVQLGGTPLEDPIVEEYISSDMARTSQYSMFGILFVLIVLFGSLIYALTPLTVIGVGVIWTMGFLGFTGQNMSSMTSGAISMIMGIGIDFGIQTVARFRAELKKRPLDEAMEITLVNVFIPMATTTLAAVIGFKAMSLGQLTVLAELGNMMINGVVFCFLAAITFVPTISLLVERWKLYLKKLVGVKK